MDLGETKCSSISGTPVGQNVLKNLFCPSLFQCSCSYFDSCILYVHTNTHKYVFQVNSVLIYIY